MPQPRLYLVLALLIAVPAGHAQTDAAEQDEPADASQGAGGETSSPSDSGPGPADGEPDSSAAPAGAGAGMQDGPMDCIETDRVGYDVPVPYFDPWAPLPIGFNYVTVWVYKVDIVVQDCFDGLL